MDDNMMDDVWELLHSTLLEHFLHLQHAAMDDHFMDDVLELLHSTPWSASLFFDTRRCTTTW
jgi:hypothetical protein